jgi:hypothetical protein
MSELRDYSGEFKPDLQIEDFSKDFLVKLMRQWSAAYLRMTELWNDAIVRRWGTEAAIPCEVEAWVRTSEITHPRIAKALNMEPKNIVDIMKLIQILPDGVGAGIYDPEYEIINENHVIMKFVRCRTLEFYEKRNQPERIVTVCQKVDPPVIERAVTVWFPNAEMKPLWVPSGPRSEEEKGKPPCAWEFKLKSR